MRRVLKYKFSLKNMKKRILIITDGNYLFHAVRCSIISDCLKNDYEVHSAFDGKCTKLVQNNLSIYHPFNFPISIEGLIKGRCDFLNNIDLNSQVLSLLSIIQTVKPDILISDFNPIAPLCSSITKIPHIALTNTIWIPEYKEQDSLLRHFQSWNTNFEDSLDKWKEPLDSIYKRHNLSSKDNLFEYFKGNSLTLVCDDPFIFPCETSDSILQIGPILSQPLQTTSTEFIWDAYITAGSSGSVQKTAMLISSLSSLGQKLLVSQGPFDIFSSFKSQNVDVETYCNPSSINKAHFIFCQGGIGTIYQALALEKPIFFIPHHSEQFWNAKMLQNRDLGLIIDVLEDPRLILKSIHEFTQRSSESRKNMKDQLLKLNPLNQIRSILQSILSPRNI